MIDFQKAFVDTAPFIYFIEKDSNNPQYYEKVKGFFKYGYDNDKKFVSSVKRKRWHIIIIPVKKRKGD